ncbi:restriction endonuclease subunit S [Bacteroides eggerthii]|uniref:restriction endonuclease subunit S n=1 Tax=Bacteroides eggerthii TaxID=28111 RepID=UPI000E4A0B4E|nr:restriction endonuclease subunit S [Bacteroides eggerthii]RHM69675.1 restriction endonuclease subunit S [Bacteroides eggerthii]
MNGKQLKNSILQWAIQGKLVPQDPNDEPASVLLERIRAEKARLVKEKKIKKDKNESIIYRGEDNSYYEKFLATGEVKCIDEEIPFEIPQGWEWSRMGSIGDWGAGATPAKGNTSYYGGNILWLRTGELNNSIVNDTEIKITDKALKECSLRLNKAGDVLIAMYGATIGKVAIAGCELTTNQACCACTPIGIFNYYLFYFLMGNQVDFIKKGEGGAQPNISREKLVAHLMPIPPIQEQHRIVERIKDVLPLTDKYAHSQIALDELNRSINGKLKKSILQEAIQGRLVPQVAEEGTAQELLEQIKLEKQKLVKEGNLKKSALSDSVIYKGDDNKYYERINGQIIEIELSFEYPNSWAVLRLKDICQLIDGEKKNEKGICLDAKYLRGKSSAIIVEKGKFVYTGDNIILVDGENSGEVFTVPQDGYMGSTFKQLWLSSTMWKPYILAFILFYKEDLRNSKRGAAIPHLNKELFYNLPIGIPPYQEQQRIAKRINKLSQLLK